MTYWDDRFARDGRTGYSDPLTYAYDQPIRLRRIARLLDGLYPAGLQGRMCLDIGCGTGDIVNLLSERGAHVTGIDISKLAIAAVRQRFRERPNVQFVAGAVEEVAFPAQTFDLITSVTVLEHVMDDERLGCALTTLRTALRPGGRLVALELAPAASLLQTSEQEYMRASHYMAVRSMEAWEAVFTSSGLSIELVRPYSPIGLSIMRRLERTIAWLRSAHAPLARARSWTDRGLAVARWFILSASGPLDRRVALSWQALKPEFQIFVLHRDETERTPPSSSCPSFTPPSSRS